MKAEPTTVNPAEPNWFLKNRFWFIPGLLIGIVLLFGAIIAALVVLTGIPLQKTEVYRDALEKARTHPQVVAALGEPIEPGWYITGTFTDFQDGAVADLVILLRGPRASGLLHAEAYDYRHGEDFEDLTLDVKQTGQRIFLHMDMPPHDVKLVKRLDRVAELVYKGREKKAREQMERLAAAFPDQPLVYLRRGYLHLAADDYQAAIADAGRVMALHDPCRAAYQLRADAAQQSGDLPRALADYAKLMELEPEEPWHVNNRAWILCTTQKDAIRNGAEAVILAEQAASISGRKVPGILDTLACAYAETGDFEQAVKIQEEALALEQPVAQKEELAKRLERFREGLPYRVAGY